MSGVGEGGRVPFTVQADLDLGRSVEPWLRERGADVCIRRGAVPAELSRVKREGPVWQCAGDRVLIRLPWDVAFLVEDGRSIIYEAKGGIDNLDLRLFLLNMPWLALAMQRGLLPLHASAVAHGEEVHAFTAPSGGGKSTLAAALSARGHALFADDILLLEPVRSDEVYCYGYKDLKLWHEGAALAGARLGGRCRTAEDYDKRYAEVPRLSPHSQGSLKTLYLLREANPRVDDAARISDELKGRLAVARLFQSIHRRRLADAVLGERRIAEWLAAVVPLVAVRFFWRRMIAAHFNQSLERVAAALPRGRLGEA